jgi:hypothetical protein
MRSNEPRSGIGRQLGLDTQPPGPDDQDLPIHIRVQHLGQQAAWVGLSIFFVLVLYAVGSWLDQEAEQRAQASNKRVRAAYVQGLDDAMTAIQGQAEGVALMQACMALQNTLENRFERGDQGAMATAPSASATNRAGG